MDEWAAGLIQERDCFFKESFRGAKAAREPKREWIDIDERVKGFGSFGTGF